MNEERTIMSTTDVTIQMDEDLKKQAEELFSDLGLNMTTAFITFVKQAVREQRIPFSITRNVMNAKSIEDINNEKHMKKNHTFGKTYNNVDEILEDLLK